MKARPRRVYISPSQQPYNRGVGDYGTEQYQMHRLGWLVGYHLVTAGYQVAISRMDQQLTDVVRSSNAWLPNLHLVLHSNAGGGRGVECFYYPGSPVGTKVADALFCALGQINPGGRRRCVPNAKLIELSQTDAPAAYVEVGFHDNPEEAKWIVGSTGLIARTIADTVVQCLGEEV